MGNNLSDSLNIIRGSNITNINDFGAVFNMELERNYVTEKNKELKKLVNEKNKMPKVSSSVSVPITNEEYLYLTKNFINYFNENNDDKMAYLKKSFGLKYFADKKYVLYFILFYCEFADFVRSSKAQNILFLSLSEKDKPFNFTESIIFAKILGQWPASDVLMGSENEFAKIRFINIIQDRPIRYIMDEHIIKDILANKEYITDYFYDRGFPPKTFVAIPPQYIKIDKPSKVQIGDKCLSVDEGKVSFVNCEETEAKFQSTNDYKLKYTNNNDNTCVDFHGNNDITLAPCDTLQRCNGDAYSNLQSCQILKYRKYGGLEITDYEKEKCLNSTGKYADCSRADKVTLK